jgi:hypothetical protein
MEHIMLKGILASFAICVAVTAVRAEDANGKAADNKIFAQTLVNQLMRDQAGELLIVGLHGVPPGSKDEMIIACNLDHIHNLDAPDDIGVVQEHETVLLPKGPDKFTVMTPLKDASGKDVGGLVMIFKRHPHDTEKAFYLKAMAIRDGLAQQIPNFPALFAAAK